jgi:fibronectin-binding autotransporter adhesin
MMSTAAWALAGLSVAAFFSESARGQSVTYTLNGSITSGSASWSQPGTWTGGAVANGTGNTADFSENLLTGNLAITLDGNQTIGSLLLGDAGATYNTTIATGTGGSLTLAASSGIPVINVANGSATISAVITGASGLDETGNGNLILSAANTFTGLTQVTGGILTLGNALALQDSTLDYSGYGGSLSFGTLTAATLGGLQGSQNIALTNTLSANVGLTVAGAAAPYSGVISGGGALTVSGAGILTLTGANTYTGSTTIDAGVLNLNFNLSGAPTSNIIASGSALVVAGGTLNVTGGFSAANTQTFNGLTLNAGGAELTLTTNGNPLLLNLGGISRTIGGSADFSQPTSTLGSTNGFTTTAVNTNGILGGWASVNQTDWASNNGTNIVALPAASYSSTWTAGNNFTVTLAANTIPAGSTTNSLRFGATTPNVARAVTLSGTNIITSGGILVADNVGAVASTITGGALEGPAGGDLIVLQYDTSTAGALTISSIIADNGSPTGLTKSGGGNLILSAANTYTGATIINAGTLTLGVMNAIGGSSAVTVNGGTFALAKLPDAVGSFTLVSGSLTSGSTAGTLSANTINLQSGTVAAILEGSGGMTKTTGGTVVISKAGSYTGAVAIKAGTIQLGVASALPTGDALTLGDNTVSPNTGGTLDLEGFNQSVAGLSSVGNGLNIVTNSAAAGNTATLTITKAGSFGGIIQNGSGGVSVSITSGASATFTGANTYTGQTLIQNATLILAGTGSTLSASDQVELNMGTGTGGALQLGNATAGASNQTLSALIIGAGTTNRVIGGNTTHTSTLTINNSAADAFQGYLGSGTADSATVSAANDLTLTKTGSGTLTLGNSLTTATVSTYDGGTNVNQGTLALGIANALPAATTLTFGTGTLTSGAVNINGGTLDLAGFSDTVGAVTLTSGSIVDSVGGATLTGASYAVQSGIISAALGGSASTLTKTTSGLVTLSGADTYAGGTNVNAGTLALGATNTLASAGALNIGGGTLDLSGFSDAVGAVTLTGGSIVNSGAAAVLTGSSYTVQAGAVSAVLGGALSPLTKTGSGTVTLTAANTYGGATVVSAGVLNMSATQTGGGAFSVNDGALLDIDLTAGGQTLNTSSLTLGSKTGASVTFSLGTLGNTTAPVINTGSLTLNGSDVLNISASGLNVGEFPLISYTGSIGGSGSLALGTLPARIVASLDTTSIPGLVQIDVTAFDYPKWTGAVNGDWDLDPTGAGQQGTLNWQTASSGVATRYLQGTGGTDSVLFDDSAAATATVAGGATTVNLTTTLTPVSVTVNNSALNYIFSGPGALSGTTGLLKEGSGTLIITNTGGNDYTGTTTISAGTVQVGDGFTPGAGQLGSGPVAISLSGSLVLDRPSGDDFTVVNAISGAGALLQEGGDTATLSGNNTSFTGQFTVSNGTLKLGSLSSLGSATGTVETGAVLDITGFSIPNALTLDGGAVTAVAGAGNGISGPVTLTDAGGIVNVATGATLTISGAIGGLGGLTENGGGILVLSNGSNNYTGGTTINAGTLRLGNVGVLGGASNSISVPAGATLDIAGLVIAYPLQLNGGTLESSSGALGAESAPVTLAANSFVSVPANATLTISGAIGGPGGLTQSGSGALILSGPNTYSGGTTVNGGALEFVSASAVPSLGSINLSAGVTLVLGYAFDQTLVNDLGYTLAAATIALTVNDANNLNFANQPAASLGAVGAVTYSGNVTPAAANYYFGGGGGTLTVASPISGALNLIVGATGPGIVILSAANSFTGSTTVTAGTLELGNAQALASSSGVTVTGTLDLEGYNLTVASLAGGGIITDNSSTPGTTILTDNIASGSSQYTGSINNGPTRTIAFVKAGAGTLILNEANGSNYTGGTFLSGGVLDVRTNKAQELPNGSNVTFTGTATLEEDDDGAAKVTGSLTLGSLTFSAGLGTVENYQGGASVTQNSTFTGAVTRAIGAAGVFTVGDATAGATPPATYAFYLTGVTPDQIISGGIYYLGTDFAVADASVGLVRALNYAGDVNTSDAVLSTNQSTLAIAAGVASVTGTDLQLSGTGNITDQPTETLDSLKIGGANNLTLDSTGAGATLTITSGGLLKTGGGTALISGGAGITTGGAGDLILRAATATDVLNIGTSILATTTGGVTISGLGMVILSGNNSYSGATNILQGTLQLGNANALPGGGSPTLIYSGATLDLAGFALSAPLQINGGTVTSSSGVAGGDSGPVVLSGAATLDAPASVVATFTGPISGTGALNKTSAGTVVLGGASTFTGNVTITLGILDITSSGALGVGPKVVTIGNANRPSLELDGSGGAITLDPSISFSLSSDGTVNTLGAIVNLAGNNTINGVISLVNGGGGNARVESQAGTLTLAGGINANGATGARSLLIGGAGNGVISGVVTDGFTSGIDDVVSVSKDGTGTWLVTGANTFSGSTTVSAGDLQVNSIAPVGTPQPLGIGAAVVTLGAAATKTAAATTGMLEYTGAVPATLAFNVTTTAGGGVIDNSGGAALSLAGAQNLGGPLTLTTGVFQVAGQISGTASNSSLTVNNAFVTLSNSANTYSGPTTVIGGGALQNATLNGVSTLSTLTLGEAVGNTGGTFDLGGFDQTLAGLSSAGTGSNVVTNSGVSGTNTLSVSGTSAFGGVIQDGPTAFTALTKTLGGALTLTGASTYSGPTSINAGAVIVSGSISGTVNVAVNSGGTLGGSGSIATGGNGNVTVAAGGILSPGSTTGTTLTLELGTGQLDLSAAAGGIGYLLFGLGTTSDQLELTSGVLNIGTGLSLSDFSFSNSGGFGPGSYVLFATNSDIIGTLGSNTSGTVLGISSTLTFAGGPDGRDDLVLLVVPEPRAGVSMIGGLALLVGLQRRRRK